MINTILLSKQLLNCYECFWSLRWFTKWFPCLCQILLSFCLFFCYAVEMYILDSFVCTPVPFLSGENLFLIQLKFIKVVGRF